MCSDQSDEPLKSTAEKMGFFHGEQAWGFQSDLMAIGEEQAGHHEEENVLKSEEEEEGGSGDQGMMSTPRSKVVCARGHWRPAEDAKLMELVSRHGPQNWNLIAKSLESRSGKMKKLVFFFL